MPSRSLHWFSAGSMQAAWVSYQIDIISAFCGNAVITGIRALAFMLNRPLHDHIQLEGRCCIRWCRTQSLQINDRSIRVYRSLFIFLTRLVNIAGFMKVV